MPWSRSQQKYGARKTTYKGVVYDSQREADYAAELDLRVRAGELTEWKRQVPIPLVVNGAKIATYYIDFVEVAPGDTETYTEVKGYKTALWKLKWKLFEALYPEISKKIVT